MSHLVSGLPTGLSRPAPSSAVGLARSSTREEIRPRARTIRPRRRAP
ncbi:hypothetical protein FB563_7398 [Streptomyces puniciscabiei]|uniref:Uncharacterized protein n=1 Tax=Streptomyces puniciscabiei TaxID=164348 RepID=A0A542T030_9ACTN|nr:hypothetical protein FB563_7398 [Streptomyces puniciscabiei]